MLRFARRRLFCTPSQQGEKLKIAHYPMASLTHPALPVRPAEIGTPEFKQKIENLNNIATKAKLWSISAPQAFWDAQVVLLKNHPDETYFEAYVNPFVPEYESKTSVAPMYGYWETCVSCSSTCAWVIRPQQIPVSYLTLEGEERKNVVLRGMKARLLMHEYDHLHGIVMFHRALSTDFVVSHHSLLQKEVWPANFPSAEAYVTDACQFFDYVKNEVVIPEGLEWVFATAPSMQDFNSRKLKQE